MSRLRRATSRPPVVLVVLVGLVVLAVLATPVVPAALVVLVVLEVTHRQAAVVIAKLKEMGFVIETRIVATMAAITFNADIR